MAEHWGSPVASSASSRCTSRTASIASALAEVDRFRVTNILLLSLGVAFFAFVPVVLDEVGLSADQMWRTSSVLLAAYYAGMGASLPRRMRSFTPEDHARMGTARCDIGG